MQIRKTSLFVFCLLGVIFPLTGQISVPFDSIKWDIRSQKHEFKEYKGQPALFMHGGIAILRDSKFKDGIIEWDMAFPEQRGFTGIRFRMQDLRNFEEFYFRPHQSGNPDANQYCPVFNGVSSWQLYHGEEYGVPYEYNFNKWFHVKLVVSGSRAELYVDNMRTPILHIPFLKHDPQEGQLMVSGARVPVYFANFSYQAVDMPKLVNAPVEEQPLDPLAIDRWYVSEPFAESDLKDVYHIKNLAKQNWTWKELPVENSGTANLASISNFAANERNTVFAKLVLNSSTEQIKALQLGFSDRAKVYCNGQAIFSGNDSYATRDYRYLGTIGFFDTVYLPLKKGRNEIWVAVSETFGGWGIRGKLENLEGIRIIK